MSRRRWIHEGGHNNTCAQCLEDAHGCECVCSLCDQSVYECVCTCKHCGNGLEEDGETCRPCLDAMRGDDLYDRWKDDRMEREEMEAFDD